MVDIFRGLATTSKLILINTELALPFPIARFLINLPTQRKKRADATLTTTLEVAHEVFDEKLVDLANDRGGKDLMSLFVKSNASENAKTRMTEKEVLGGI